MSENGVTLKIEFLMTTVVTLDCKTLSPYKIRLVNFVKKMLCIANSKHYELAVKFPN